MRFGRDPYWPAGPSPQPPRKGGRIDGGVQSTLERSEAVYRRAFESATQGLYIADAEGRFTAVNRSFARILGFAGAEELLQILETVTSIPYVDQRRRDEIASMLGQRDRLLGVESLVRRRDGRTVWISETIRLVRDTDGQVTGVEGSMVEVADRKEMEQALKRAVERLAALSRIERANLTSTTAGQIAATAVDAILSVIHYDVGLVVLFDRDASRAHVIATAGDDDYWPPEGAILPLDALAEEWEQAGPPVRHTDDLASTWDHLPILDHLAHQGLRSVLRTLLIAGGAPLGEVVVASTQPDCFSHEDLWVIQEAADALAIGLHRAKLHEALAAERELQQLTLHALPTGILLLDSRGHILVENPAAHDFLPLLTDAGKNMPVTELGGRRLVDLVSGVEAGRWVEIPVNRGNPRVFEILATKRVLSGGAPGLVVVIQDVTKARIIERQLLLQERLAGIGQLAAGIAHDFNNLLQGIELDAERTLSLPNVPDAAVEAQDAIVSRARCGARLIRQLLDSCRTSCKVRETISLRAVVGEHLGLLRRMLPQTIELVARLGDDDLLIEGDAGGIQRAVANLVLNARDAMPTGGLLEVNLSTLLLSEGMVPPVGGMLPGRWTCLRVSDSGTGIPPELQPHILEPFFTTKQPGQGTGLGLPQVYGIATEHHGFMSFSSRQGAGSTFSLYFPLVVSGAAPAGAPRRDVEAVQRGNGELVLVVEDDCEVLALVTETLNELGYEAVGTLRGDRAIEIYGEREQRFSLVITDLIMPGMSGLELSTKLEALDPHARVLIMSGCSPGDVQVPQNASVVGWVTKPFSVATLGRVVANALHLASAGPSAVPVTGAEPNKEP